MLYLVALAFPFALLALLLVMERVEAPLRSADQLGSDLVTFLESARPDELEGLVRDGFGPTLDRYWKRRRHRHLIASR